MKVSFRKSSFEEYYYMLDCTGDKAREDDIVVDIDEEELVLHLIEIERGRSAVNFWAIDVYSDPKLVYRFSLKAFVNLIEDSVIDCGIFEGRFRVKKQGEYLTMWPVPYLQ